LLLPALKCVPVGAGLPAIAPAHSPQGWQASVQSVGHVSGLPPLSRASPHRWRCHRAAACLKCVPVGAGLPAIGSVHSPQGWQVFNLSAMCRVCHRYRGQARSHRWRRPLAAACIEMRTCGSWLASDRACAFAPGLASVQSVGHVSGLPPLSRASPLPQVALPSCCCLLEMHTCGSWLASDRACAFTSGLPGQRSMCRPCVGFAIAIAGKPHR
jgi:hypothetical protein